MGAVIACIVVTSIHTIISSVIFPYPVAQGLLRHKIATLPQFDQVSVIIAGDSRAHVQIIPEVIANELSIPVEKTINIAINSGDSSQTLAAYRELSTHFVHHPIMLLSVSLVTVNDRARDGGVPCQEMLWSIGLLDRFRLVSPQRALLATFLPERELCRRATQFAYTLPKPMAGRGFRGVHSHVQLNSPEAILSRVRRLDYVWYNDADIDGLRWQQLVKNMQTLLHQGVQVVMLDTPEHPAFVRAIKNTPMDDVNTRFHKKLATLCKQLHMPLLRYDVSIFDCHDLDGIFYDLLHVNQTGAELLSQRVGQDLSDLIERGVLQDSACD